MYIMWTTIGSMYVFLIRSTDLVCPSEGWTVFTCAHHAMQETSNVGTDLLNATERLSFSYATNAGTSGSPQMVRLDNLGD